MHFGSAQCKQKGFAQLFLVILALGLIISGVYLYQSKKSSSSFQNPSFNTISEFKDYSSQLGFQFKYSKDLTAKEDTEEEFNKRGKGDFRKNFKGYVQYEPGKLLGAVVVLDKSNSFDTNPFTVWVFDNPNDLSIDKWYGNFWYYPFVWGDFTYTGKTTLAPKDEATISGKVGKSGTIDYQPGKPKFVYLSLDKKMYLFRIIGNTGDQILSSFKLLKSETKKVEGCKVGGCSGQLCVEENKSGISTCEWRNEYVCYKTAKCEIQPDGKCGWTKTEQLSKCLSESENTSVEVPQ